MRKLLKAKPFSASGELFIYMEAAFTVIKCFEIKGKKKKKNYCENFLKVYVHISSSSFISVSIHRRLCWS